MRITLFFILIFLFACHSQENQSDNKAVKKPQPKRQEKKIEQETPDKNTKAYRLVIELDSFTILFQTTRDWTPTISKVNKDTASLEIDYAGRISELILTVVYCNSYDSVMIEQNFENALTLTNMEGKFVHLKKWWRLDTNWRKIPITNGIFKINEYDKTAEKKFKESLSTQFKEIKSEALTYKADNYYAPIIKKATTVEMLPLSTWTSKYIVKITIRKNGRKIEKYLILQDEYGC